MTPWQLVKQSTPRLLVAGSLMAGFVAAVAGPAAAQEPPTFTIVKDAQPNSAQDFTFIASGPQIPGDGIFTLDDDGSDINALPSSLTFTLAPNPEGSGLDPYVITEDAIDGWELDDIECTLNGEPQDLADIAVFDGDDLIGVSGRLDLDDAAVCTFINVADDDDDDNGYDDYPGDSDFDFDTPFDIADNDDPAPPVQVAATSEPVVTAQPGVPVLVAGEVAPAAAAPEAAPVALAELPRTGSPAKQMTMVAGLFLIAGGVASLIGRRRKATSA